MGVPGYTHMKYPFTEGFSILGRHHQRPKYFCTSMSMITRVASVHPIQNIGTDQDQGEFFLEMLNGCSVKYNKNLSEKIMIGRLVTWLEG